MSNDDLVRVQKREIWTGTSSLPRGGRSMRGRLSNVSAMASEIPPSNWIRSAMVSTISTCSS